MRMANLFGVGSLLSSENKNGVRFLQSCTNEATSAEQRPIPPLVLPGLVGIIFVPT